MADDGPGADNDEDDDGKPKEVGKPCYDNKTRAVYLSLGEASKAEEEGFAGWAPLYVLHGILQA